MVKPDEGYIKFNLHWDQKEFDFLDDDFKLLNSYRTKLFELNLIGAYPDGIGFGNISIRTKENHFIISGSATGNERNLEKKHYSLVTDFDIRNNLVHSVGLTKASSESMSHAAIYMANKKIKSVIHIHHKKMWNYYLHTLPTTNEKAEFGTPELAFEVQKHVNSNNGIIIMGGHPEGIITYGHSIEKAYNTLIEYYNKI
jgi:ribulose-5-phosphate 4-epimerase/fuculose-1-phosphate aldolase